MKHILFLRHAKSSWSDPGLDDFDRPLSGRGLKDAPRMGKYLRKVDYKPNYVVSSPAQRAMQTTQLCVEGMKKDEDIINWDRGLYFDTPLNYIQAVRKTPDHVDTMMLVGHNPLIESATSLLCGGNDGTSVRVPTAGLVCLESFALRWEDIKLGSCQIKWMMIPKILKDIID